MAITLSQVGYGRRKPSSSRRVDPNGIGRGIVGYWPCTDGVATLHDVVNGYNITGAGATITAATNRRGNFGSCCPNVFGAATTGTCPKITGLSTGPATILLWINLMFGANNGNQIITKGNGSTLGWLISFVFGTGTISVNRYTSSGAVGRVSTNIFPSTNFWQLAVSWDGSLTAANTKIYMNGVECGYGTTTNGTGTITAESTSSELTCGLFGSGKGSPPTLQYDMDHLVIWNRQLMLADIRQLYKEPFDFISQPNSRKAFARSPFNPSWAMRSNILLDGGTW